MVRSKGWLAAGMMLLAAACAAPVLQPAPLERGPLGESYVPLSESINPRIGRYGAGLVISPGIAVTNAHNANLLPPNAVLARSPDYDLLFFRTGRAAVPAFKRAYVGEAVIAYGNGAGNPMRAEKGVVRSL